MSGEPENLVLEYLRRFDRRLADMDAKIDRILDDVHMLKVRMTAVEENLVGVQRRIDRVEERLERVERRVGLVEAPH
jgi:predicted  nucleic acid-binding Zn-ribbon protein